VEGGNGWPGADWLCFDLMSFTHILHTM